MTRKEHAEALTRLGLVKMDFQASQELIDHHWMQAKPYAEDMIIEDFEKALLDKWNKFGNDLYNQQRASRN